MFRDEIKLGAIIWYSGHSSIHSWDCPAEIIQVDYAKETFRVKSLDDMAEQKQEYTFDTDENSPVSRLSMRQPEPGEVRKFLNHNAQRKTQRLLQTRRILEEQEAEMAKIASYLSRTDVDLIQVD